MTVEILLAEVQYEARTDHLIFAGDFISKGPSSPAVINLAMSAHASCVRGNHEDRVLLAYRDLYSHRLTQEQKGKEAPSPPAAGMPEDMRQNSSEDDGEDLEEKNFSHGDFVDRRLAESFTKRQIDYMASCPVILDIGQIKGLGDVHVVHAGLVPGVRLERQDPMGVMHMRTIDLDTHVPSSSAKGTPWFKVCNFLNLPALYDSGCDCTSQMLTRLSVMEQVPVPLTFTPTFHCHLWPRLPSRPTNTGL